MFKVRIWFLLLFITLANAQQQKSVQKKQETPLKEILFELEKQYDIRFSYDPNVVKKYACLPFTSEKNLEEKLTYLKIETPLSFEKIDERYIVINVIPPKKNQKICGFILDEKTGNPIAQAAVFTEKNTLGTYTNDKGFFSINGVQSDEIIRVTYLGYFGIKYPVWKMVQKNCVSLFLAENNEELQEVLISDYLTQGMVKKNNGSIQVSPKKLGILPGLTEPDVLQSLQLLPGIQSPNETAAGIQVRGSTSDQNLILFDGIKMYQSGHFFGLISSFNPYVTQKIELFRSGTSAIYGDRIGGVLDVSSGDDIPTFSAGVGVNMTHADAFIKTPLLNNKVGLVFSTRRSLTDVWNSITYQKFSESVFQNTRIVDGDGRNANIFSQTNNVFYFKDYNLKLVAQLTKNDKLIFSNIYNKNELNYEASNPRFRETVTDKIQIENVGFNLKWDKKFSEKWQQVLEFSNSEYALNYSGSRSVVRKNQANNSTEIFGKFNSVADVGLKWSVSHKINATSKLINGYQFANNNVGYRFENEINTPENQTLESLDDTKNTSHAFFSEYQYQSDSKWYVRAGFRFNQFSTVSKFFVEPRFFASYKLNNNLQFKLSGEIKNQVLSQLIEFRNNGLPLENDVWALSNNTTIPVLKSNQISGGFLYQKKGWNLDVDFYKKNISGLTLLTEDLLSRAPKYYSGESNIAGMDFLLKKKIGNYRSWIAYTASKALFTYKRINNNQSFKGTYDIPHSFLWSHTLMHRNFEYSLGWKIRSGTPYTRGIGLEDKPNSPIGNKNNKSIVYGDVNANRLPSFQKFDFSATYKFKVSEKKNTEGKIGFSLLNLLNSNNVLDRTYEIKVIQNTNGSEREILVETDKVSIGFTPNAVFRLTF